MADVTASSEMTDALGKVEAVEMTPDGERPLSSEEKAQASTEASPAGAPAEKEVSQSEGAPVQTSQPRVEVVEPIAQQSAPAKAAPVAEETKEEPKEDMAEALKKLAEFGDSRAEEVRRAAQSAADKNTAQFDLVRRESEARARELTDSIRDLEQRDLTDEEKAKVRETYAQQDERTDLDAKAVQLEDLAKATIIDSLMFEYRDFNVSRDELESMDSAEEMELCCAHAANDLLVNRLAEKETPKEEPAAPKTEEPPVEQSKPEARVANVPAGAQSPTDVGAGGTPPAENKFSEEQTTDAMRENLKNAQWSTVRIKG